MKMYVLNENLNENEKRTNRVSYKRLIDRISYNRYLLNNAPELSDYDLEFVCGTDYDEETDSYTEIYQYFLIDLCIDEDDLKKLENEIIIAWSEKLDNYILCVDHFGTSWDYVETGIEPTENIEESDI